MTGGQIAALILAILLLLPGGCFLFFGIGLGIDDSAGFLLLIPAAIILGICGLLFRLAFRRKTPPSPPGAAA